MTGDQASGLATPATTSDREAVFRAWMERHAAAVARAVAVYERDPFERQDLVQEIWIAIWKSLPSFRGESSERTFIFRIVHNRSVSHVDRRVRDRGIPGEAPDVQDDLADPLRRVSANEAFERLLAMIYRLPMMDRQLLQLSLEGLKQREISRRMIEPLRRFGITSIRNPGAHAETAVAQRAAIARGDIDAPRLFTAGDVIDLAAAPGLVAGVTTPEEMRAEVARQAELGVDFIKLYASLDPALLKVGIDAAHEHGLPAIGHLFATDWGTAAKLGIDDIVHAMPSSPAMLPAGNRQEFLGGITGSQFLYQWFEHADFDAPEMQSAIDAMAANGVRHDPTLVAVEGLFFGDKPEVVSHPRMDLVPDAVREDWHGTAGVNAAWSEEDFRRAQAVWPKVLELVARLQAAGVELTAGTDLVNPNVIPGISFHRELELLADAGIPAADVLRIATLNGARALGRENDLGTLEAGKLADIVVLTANPLEDIRNTQRIEAVYMAGHEVGVDNQQ